jgi:hypothetical protein
VDWSNERYVRLYTRDTETVLLQSWQARAVFREMLRKCDRAGVIECRTGERGLAVILNMPVDVVRENLPTLIEDGSVAEHEHGYYLPNFIEAQEAPASDKQRAKESRHTRRDRAKHGVTKPDANAAPRDSSATERDESVTRGHGASHRVTPAVLAVPAKPSQAEPAEGRNAQANAAHRAVPSRAGGKETSAAAAAAPSTSNTGRPGRDQLLDALQPSQRKAMADTLAVYAQGYQLPAGIGIPTPAQIDQACLECLASIPAHDIRPNRVRNFLIGVMRPNERSTETRTAGAVAGNVLDRLKAMSEGKA